MRARHYAGAAVVSLLVATIWLAPLVVHLDSALLQGPSDASSTIRLYESADRQGHSPFSFSQDRLLATPESTTYSWAAQVANAVQPGFVWLLGQAVGYVAAFNVFTLLAFALTGFLIYVLLVRLDVHPLAAAFGAYVFAFNPYAFEKADAGHPALAHNWVLALVVLALLRQHERRRIVDAAVVGLAVALSFYMHTYLGFVALLLVAVFLLVDLVRTRDWRTGAAATAAGLATLVVALSPAVVASVADHAAARQITSHRSEALSEFGALPSTYLRPADGSVIATAVSSRTRDERRADANVTLYFGYVTLALALAGLVLLVRRSTSLATPRRRFVAIASAALVPVAFVVSLPDYVSVFGADVPAPAALVGELTTVIRVYSRFGILVGLGLAILAALALDRVVRLRRGLLVGAALLVLAVAELAVGPPIETWRIDRPPAYDTWLAAQPRGTVAMYPPPGDTPEEEEHTRAEIFFQTVHWQPLFFTESPRKSRGWAIRELTDNLDEPGVPELLASQGVRYVVVADSVYEEIGERPPNVPETLRLLRRFDGARAYEVIAKPSDPDGALHIKAARVASAMGIPVPTVSIPGAGFHDEERFGRDGRQWRWLVQGGVIEVDVPESEIELELTGTAFSAFRNRRLTLSDDAGGVLGEVDVGTAALPFTLGPFRLPAGRTRLHLAVSPGPEPLGGSDTRNASVFLSPVEIRPLADFSRR